MCHAAHGKKVLAHIRSARDQGARLVCGGERVTVPGCEGGFFIAPTVLLTLQQSDLDAVREEIFGPVLAVIKYRDEAEAIAIANDTDYGLSAGVWTGMCSPHSALRGACAPARSGSTTGTRCAPTSPSAATSKAARVAKTASRGWRRSWRPRPIVTAFQRSPAARRLAHGALHKRFDL